MKKNVLYIGNALSNKGKTKTTIDTLSAHLKEFCSLKIASSKTNKILRLLDMMALVISNFRKTDYVLIDTYSTTNFYFALVISQICRFFNLKYIAILHGGNLEHRLKHNPKLSQTLFNNAHALVAPSNYLETVFKTYGYKDICYIPNTIEIEKYQFQERTIDTIKLFWLRAFAQHYNPKQAIYVLEGLLKCGHEAELIMVGPDMDGSLVEVKKLTAEKKLNVKFTGLLPLKEWLKFAQQSNVFINTTTIDNTPVSLVEAMAVGLPVVSTNVGGIPFLITHNINGLLVPANDVEAMVSAILRFKENKDNIRSHIVKSARQKVEKFDWNVVRQKWELLLS